MYFMGHENVRCDSVYVVTEYVLILQDKFRNFKLLRYIRGYVINGEGCDEFDYFMTFPNIFSVV